MHVRSFVGPSWDAKPGLAWPPTSECIRDISLSVSAASPAGKILWMRRSEDENHPLNLLFLFCWLLVHPFLCHTKPSEAAAAAGLFLLFHRTDLTNYLHPMPNAEQYSGFSFQAHTLCPVEGFRRREGGLGDEEVLGEPCSS